MFSEPVAFSLSTIRQRFSLAFFGASPLPAQLSIWNVFCDPTGTSTSTGSYNDGRLGIYSTRSWSRRLLNVDSGLQGATSDYTQIASALTVAFIRIQHGESCSTEEVLLAKLMQKIDSIRFNQTSTYDTENLASRNST
jgi:hypothetical protein